MPAAAFEPYDLQVEETPAGWQLTIDGEALVTVVGQHPVHHPTRDLLDRIVDEFRAYPTLSVNDRLQILEPDLKESYWFLGFQKTWIESRTDNVTVDFIGSLLEDPIWFPPPGQPEHVQFNAQTAEIRTWAVVARLERTAGRASSPEPPCRD